MSKVKWVAFALPRVHFISLGLFLPGPPSALSAVRDPFVVWEGRSAMDVRIPIGIALYQQLACRNLFLN